MTDLISTVLRDRADGDPHIERLLSAVHAGARRRRRQRLAVSACAVVTVVALAAAGHVAFPGPRGAPDRSATPATEVNRIPRPPLVTGAPVAAFTPTALGGDPTLFHLDVTGLRSWTSLRWTAMAGYEELRATSFEAGGELFVEASGSREKLPGLAGEINPTTVNGVAAEAVRAIPGAGVPPPRGDHAVRWEAVPGVWVQVVVQAGPEVALRMAERVRLDRTFRCVVPFRLTGLGDQVRVVKCETSFSGSFALGGIYLADGQRPVEYYVGVDRPTRTPTTTDTVGGRAVAVVPGGSTAHFEYPYEGGVASFYPFFAGLDDPFLRSLVPAFQPVTDPDPRTWPRSPLD